MAALTYKEVLSQLAEADEVVADPGAVPIPRDRVEDFLRWCLQNDPNRQEERRFEPPAWETVGGRRVARIEAFPQSSD